MEIRITTVPHSRRTFHAQASPTSRVLAHSTPRQARFQTLRSFRRTICKDLEFFLSMCESAEAGRLEIGRAKTPAAMKFAEGSRSRTAGLARAATRAGC